MRILFISSEVAPWSKTGGLGDVAGALPRALALRGHEVRVVSPLYRDLNRSALQLFGSTVTLEFPFGKVDVRSFRTVDHAELVFVEAPAAFDRDGYYGHSDDARRFAVLSMAALAFAQRDGFVPDVVHGNDWHAAPALLALRTGYANTTLSKAKKVFTIHNLAFQGNFPKREVEALGIPQSLFNVDGVEFYDQLSFMKTALVSADVITTVSPSYAQEIQTPTFGVGLDGLLRFKRAQLHGILNGVDTREWNPATDVFLPATFTAQDVSGREKCRRELLASVRLDEPTPGFPLFGVIGRMAGQKGADLMQVALPRLLDQGASAVVLGSGDPSIEGAWKALAAKYPRRLAIRLGFDESLAHRIEAGSDFFLMPSKFEPCGLNQMYSLLYGAVPIVHAVGGLKDTVIDFSQPRGNGVVFTRPTADSLFGALVRAVELYRDPTKYTEVQRRGLQSDFGWTAAATQYEQLYAP